MSLSRRSLLQRSGAACALALLPPVLGAATTLRRYRVEDTVALPLFAPGDLLVADSGIMHFAGPGLYLYPAWGTPRLYEVDAVSDRLQFRNPGTRQLLWTQSAGFESTFAGKVLERAHTAVLGEVFPVLSVSPMPGHA